MSLPPEDAAREGEPEVQRATKWPRWRKIMVAGALLGLGATSLDALMDGPLVEEIANVGLLATYGFLGYGFWTFFRDRNKAE